MQAELLKTGHNLDVDYHNSNSNEDADIIKYQGRRREKDKDRRKSHHSRRDREKEKMKVNNGDHHERERRSSGSRKSRHRTQHNLGTKDRSRRGEKRKSTASISSTSSDSDRRHKRTVKTHRHKDLKTAKRSAAADRKKEIQIVLHPLGPIRNSPPRELLDPDADYFKYHQHLRLFLYRRYGLYFEDLSSEDARKKFQSFVKEYNAGNVEQVYYEDEPLPSEALDQCKRTKHEWKFNTTAKELESLNFVKEGVRKQTDYKVDPSMVSTAHRQRVSDPKVQLAENSLIVGTGPMDEKNQPYKFKTQDEVVADRRANRRLREHVLTAEEEFAIGEEKKKYGREHKNHRDNYVGKRSPVYRDQEGASTELEDRDIYGDGDEANFKATVAREKLRKVKQQEDKAARISLLESKEKQKQAEMLKMLGLSNIQPGKKISIAPRVDIEK